MMVGLLSWSPATPGFQNLLLCQNVTMKCYQGSLAMWAHIHQELDCQSRHSIAQCLYFYASSFYFSSLMGQCLILKKGKNMTWSHSMNVLLLTCSHWCAEACPCPRSTYLFTWMPGVNSSIWIPPQLSFNVKFLKSMPASYKDARWVPGVTTLCPPPFILLHSTGCSSTASHVYNQIPPRKQTAATL